MRGRGQQLRQGSTRRHSPSEPKKSRPRSKLAHELKLRPSPRRVSAKGQTIRCKAALQYGQRVHQPRRRHEAEKGVL